MLDGLRPWRLVWEAFLRPFFGCLLHAFVAGCGVFIGGPALLRGGCRACLLRLVLGRGITLVGVGLAVGLLGALAAGRVLVSVLYGVGAIDLIALSTAMVLLALIALIACFFPARRATRVDPMVALREE